MLRHTTTWSNPGGVGPRRGEPSFAELLARLDAIPGIERIRYTSPHPMFFDRDLIRAHGELEALCPHVHLPLQSGSDAVLERMRRRYTRAEFLEIVTALRAEGIGANVHYIPPHLHAFYRQRFGTHEDLCPVAEAAYRRIMSLPMFPEMTDGDVNDVIRAVRKVLAHFQ